jgi:hypothetical protein
MVDFRDIVQIETLSHILRDIANKVIGFFFFFFFFFINVGFRLPSK